MKKETLNIREQFSSQLRRGRSGQDALQIHGYTKGEHIRDGISEVVFEQNNVITTVGKKQVAALITSDVGGTAFDYMALGTGSAATAAANTALTTEITSGGGARAGATGTRTNATAQWVHTWAFTSSFSLREAGLFNGTTVATATMLARQVFATVNVANGDSFRITWGIGVV